MLAASKDSTPTTFARPASSQKPSPEAVLQRGNVLETELRDDQASNTVDMSAPGQVAPMAPGHVSPQKCAVSCISQPGKPGSAVEGTLLSIGTGLLSHAACEPRAGVEGSGGDCEVAGP